MRVFFVFAGGGGGGGFLVNLIQEVSDSERKLAIYTRWDFY